MTATDPKRPVEYIGMIAISFRKLLVCTALLSIFAFIFVGCSKSYSGKLFSYPSTIPPHETGWQYLGEITVWDKSGVPSIQPVQKKMVVTVQDASGNQLLFDELRVTGGTFRHDVTWENVGDLRISVSGVNPPSDRPIVVLSYSFDGTKFSRVTN